MATKHSAARAKGKSGEREIKLMLFGAMLQVENYLQVSLDDRLSEKIQRNLQQSIDGGADIVGIPFYAVEVKRVETPQINSWWQQALEQAQKVKLSPVLVWKIGRQEWKSRTHMKHQCGQWIASDLPFMDWLKAFQTQYHDWLKEKTK